MLDDLTGRVLERSDSSHRQSPRSSRRFVKAVEQGGPRACEAHVQRRAEAGQLIVVVSYAGGREWRVARALPD